MTWHEVPPSDSLSTETPSVQPAASKRGRKKRADLPSPGIRKETLGVFPVNGYGVSALHTGVADTMLGYAYEELSVFLKDRGSLRLQSGKKTEPLELKGKFYNGLADAFYRAQLPQVLLVTALPDAMATFADNVLDYVEKLVSLGFFLRHKDPVQEYIPGFVIAGPGLLFSGLIAHLSENLNNLTQLTEHQRLRILEQFTRATFSENTADYQTPSAGSAVELGPVTTTLRLAGTNQTVLEQVHALLTRRGWTVAIESQTPNSVERLELESVLQCAVTQVIPRLKREKRLKAEAASVCEEQLRASILAIGQARQAFTEKERFVSPKPESTYAPVASQADVAAYRVLARYASGLGRMEDISLYDTLADKLADSLRKAGA